jgi:diguanylate cyclase (GGDEF)-like protein
MRGEAERPDRVLLVDDSRELREQVGQALGAGVRLESVRSADAALESLTRQSAELVVSDLALPGASGLELFERVRRLAPETGFVLLVPPTAADTALTALRMGAADCLRKPVSPEELALCIGRVLSQRRLSRENERLRDMLGTFEACRSLLHCAEPGEVHAVSLDLLLHALGRSRGIAIFRRTAIPGSAEGMVFRGLDEMQARELHRGLAREKLSLAPGDDAAPRDLPCAPFEDLLREAGVPGGPVLSIPIRGGASETGVAWVFADGRVFDEGSRERARLVAGHATLALGNAERYHRAKERAFVDDVTEVYNARYLLQATEREIQRAERSGKDLSVLFLDLDRFKRVNDVHGHLVGSQVLRRLSEVLAECIRQVDTLARYGGDEFTILLVDTTHEGALGVAERIRRTVADTLFEGEGGSPIRLTISIGVATSPLHASGRDTLLDLADKAMYRAKSLGRNCVCSANDLQG